MAKAVYDSSTGLYYMNARYYDASIGRFISQDSYRGEIDNSGTWHLYTYCKNNPINYADPSGHFWDTILDLAGVALSLNDFKKNKTWANAGYLIVDTVALFVPYIPGTKAGRAAANSLTKTTKASKATKAGNQALKMPMNLQFFAKTGYRDFVNKTHKDFWKQYNKLPKNIQKQAQKNFKLFEKNMNHPSLNFEALAGGEYFSVRINEKYRAYARKLDDNTIQWVEINGHNYKKALSSLKDKKY